MSISSQEKSGSVNGYDTAAIFEGRVFITLDSAACFLDEANKVWRWWPWKRRFPIEETTREHAVVAVNGLMAVEVPHRLGKIFTSIEKVTPEVRDEVFRMEDEGWGAKATRYLPTVLDLSVDEAISHLRELRPECPRGVLNPSV